MTLRFVLDDYVDHMVSHLRHIGVTVDDILVTASRNERSTYPEKPAQTDFPINELMRRRWSPRAFEDGRTVEREKLLTLLEAARWAPSCFNDQPRNFLVFDGSDSEALERARGCLTPGNAWALKAPVLVLSVARDTFEQNGKPNRWAQHDVGLATENLLLEAIELGLSAHPMAGYDAERARSEFRIPEGHTPIAMIAIGYPYSGNLDELGEKLRGKELALRERKPMSEIAFAGFWGRSL
jgi:nitroreductase